MLIKLKFELNKQVSYASFHAQIMSFLYTCIVTFCDANNLLKIKI